jgi:hypothetical protein
MDFAPNHAIETIVVNSEQNLSDQEVEASLKHGVSLNLVKYKIQDVASLPLLHEVVLGKAQSESAVEIDVFCNDVLLKRCKLSVGAGDAVVRVQKRRQTFVLCLSLRAIAKDSTGSMYVLLSAPLLKTSC